MGCCVSTNGTTSPPPKGLPLKQQHFLVGSTHRETSSRAPPPSIEEETVKEVLSEIPKPNNNVNPHLLKYPTLEPPKYQINTTNTTKVSHVENVDLSPTVEKESSFSFQEDLPDDVVSEQARSELSSSTITNDFSYDEEREVKSRRARSSPVATSKVNQRTRPGRDRVVGKSPNRRSEQSPVKRGVYNNASSGGGSGSVRVVQSREQLTGGSGPGVVRRGLRYEPNRRDLVPGSIGDSKNRRSRSPATNRSVMGHSPSNHRRTNRSPGRVRTDPNESGGGAGSKVEENEVGGNKWPASNTTATNGTTSDGNANNESLENPLVSLECFIFL